MWVKFCIRFANVEKFRPLLNNRNKNTIFALEIHVNIPLIKFYFKMHARFF